MTEFSLAFPYNDVQLLSVVRWCSDSFGEQYYYMDPKSSSCRESNSEKMWSFKLEKSHPTNGHIWSIWISEPEWATLFALCWSVHIVDQKVRA
jgi:hypothetical protein